MSETQCFLRSIRDQDYPAELVETLLIDDGSTDATVERARNADPDLQIIRSSVSRKSINRDIGWRRATHDHIAFLDADCTAKRGWLSNLVDAIERLSAAAVGGPVATPGAESGIERAISIVEQTRRGSARSTQGLEFGEERELEHLPGANVMYRRSALEQVGGYDRDVELSEDGDLSQRLRDAGYRLFYVPDARVTHREWIDLRGWLSKMVKYGRGRMQLFGRHPRAIAPEFLIPLVLPLLAPVYLPGVAGTSIWKGIAEDCPELVPELLITYLSTHLSYGAGELAELLGGCKGRPKYSKERKPFGLVFSHRGVTAENIQEVTDMCRDVERLARSRWSDLDPYVVSVGPEAFDVRMLPRDQRGVRRVVNAMFLGDNGSRAEGFVREVVERTSQRIWSLLKFRGLVFCRPFEPRSESTFRPDSLDQYFVLERGIGIPMVAFRRSDESSSGRVGPAVRREVEASSLESVSEPEDLADWLGMVNDNSAHSVGVDR
ncbi:MAG: glycosyltransferase [Bradymonadaceae bacterium]